MKKNFLFYLILLIVLSSTSLYPSKVKAYKIRKVVIDAGHGGKDSGTIGRFTKEKDITLSIALKLGKIIEENIKDVEVIYTRKKDIFIPLNKRAEIANKAKADLFISIHCNGGAKHTVKGTETYVMGVHSSDENLEVAKRENSAILLENNYKSKYEGYNPKSLESHILFSMFVNSYMDNSLNFAQKIETQFHKRVGRKTRGVKQAGFVVLWRTTMPSVLVEVGFLSNKDEERYLNDALGKTYIASGIFRAFKEYKKEIEFVNLK